MGEDEWTTNLNRLNSVYLKDLIEFDQLLKKFERKLENIENFIESDETVEINLNLNQLYIKMYYLIEMTTKAIDTFQSSRSFKKENLLKIYNRLLFGLHIEIPKIKTLLSEYMENGRFNQNFNEKIIKIKENIESIIKSEFRNQILEYNLIYYDIEFSDSVVEDETMSMSLRHYVEIANSFNFEDPNLLNIINTVKGSVKDIYIVNEDGSRIYQPPKSASSYSAIVGPSFMGKTQLSFILSRAMPVFYFNLSNSYNIQPVYKSFHHFNKILTSIIPFDKEILNNCIESNSIFVKFDVKLRTIGLIWNLIQYSSKFQNDYSNGEWFNYYLASRRIVFEPLSLREFYELIGKLFKDTPDFKISVIFIDELPLESMENIKFLRNLVRCLALPCILSSTNARVSNMLNMTTTSSIDEFKIWVNATIKLSKANLEGILNRINVVTFGHGTFKMLIEFADENFNLKTVDGSICLLQDLNIQSDQKNRHLLSKIWDFIKIQSFSNLQGTSFYSFLYFVSGLKEFSGRQLNSRQVWITICTKISNSFQGRKEISFSKEGRYFSLKMFCTIRKYGCNNSSVIKENLEDNSEGQVLNSIDQHFYYFGEGDENTNVLSFKCNRKGNLLLNSVAYKMKSYYKSFEKDFFTCMALWTLPAIELGDSVAEVSKSHDESFSKDPPNPSASVNDFRSQEVMAYWSLADSSHQNYQGETGGIDFIKNFAENVQLKIGNSYPVLETQELPSNLSNFLSSIIVPYLLPHEPNINFESALEGICLLGTCSRCSNNTGLDISFDLIKEGTRRTGYVECKYTDHPQTLDPVLEYITHARSKKSPLTIFLTFNLDSQLKRKEKNLLDLNPRNLRHDVNTIVAESKNSFKIVPRKRSHGELFNLNVYSIYLDGGSFNCIPLFEKDQVSNPDGVFIILETNFDIPNV